MDGTPSSPEEVRPARYLLNLNISFNLPETPGPCIALSYQGSAVENSITTLRDQPVGTMTNYACHGPSPKPKPVCAIMRYICDKNGDKYGDKNSRQVLRDSLKQTRLSQLFLSASSLPPSRPPTTSYHDKCPVAPSNLPSPLALPLPEIATCAAPTALTTFDRDINFPYTPPTR